MLYEVAFTKGSLSSPFYIYTVSPRTIVPPNTTITELGLKAPSVLIAETVDNAPDPLELFGSGPELQVHGSHYATFTTNKHDAIKVSYSCQIQCADDQNRPCNGHKVQEVH